MPHCKDLMKDTGEYVVFAMYSRTGIETLNRTCNRDFHFPGVG
jgi:hypothetical protein